MDKEKVLIELSQRFNDIINNVPKAPNNKYKVNKSAISYIFEHLLQLISDGQYDITSSEYDRQNNTSYFFISTEKIAKEYGFDQKTVVRAMRYLIDTNVFNLVEKARVFDYKSKSGKITFLRQANRFRLNIKK
ncbi:MAG: hypothetical protein QXT97_02450 [Candidatus Diapherotrites archaeon]